jgi:predicted transposase/invertase (TIGR01784 family)
MLYYAGRLISDMAPKGKRKVWNYGITEVYVIVLMDGFTLPDSTNDQYLHDICLCNRDNGEIFYEGLGFIYLELLNFVKTETELETDLDRWLYVLKNMAKMDKVPLYLRKPIFEKLFNIAEYCNLTREEKEMYDVELKRKWDNANIMAYAKAQAKAEGLAEGEAKGKVKGKTEGKAEVVVTSWKNGFTLEQLQTITGWDKDKINEVLKRNHLL